MSILFARYDTNAGVATSDFQRAYHGIETQLPFWKNGIAETAAAKAAGACDVLATILPAAGFTGMSQSPAASFAMFCALRAYAMNCIASALCWLCCEIENVCGFATWACEVPLSGGNIAQLKPFGLCSILPCAW